jgi:hypothetical protein
MSDLSPQKRSKADIVRPLPPIAIYEYLSPTEILIFRPEPFVDRGPARRNGHFTRSVYGAAFRES